MTNPIINPQPNYSGVTIQIVNPSVNAGHASVPPELQAKYGCYPPFCCCESPVVNNTSSINSETGAHLANSESVQGQTQVPAQSYPAQYYLNNYNYQTNGRDFNGSNANDNISDTNSSEVIRTKSENSSVIGNENSKSLANNVIKDNSSEDGYYSSNATDGNNYDASGLVNRYAYAEARKNSQEQDFTKSTNIINDLDARETALQEAKKNTKEKRVVALTDEYIKSLENYLNNPNNEIRLMASKEILTRLDEDKDRYNDAALNALLNKMLQDPSKMVRIAALSAFASQLASGNDYTIQLLQNIQNNPSADKEDVLQAADILLKMSADTEIKRVPIPLKKETNSKVKG